jgi:putative acetyltransferase
VTLRALRDDPGRPDVVVLLEEHLADMWAASPPESVHALDPAALGGEGIAFWTVRVDGEPVGCGALAPLDAVSGEVKSMRTAASARGRGIATILLAAILDEARRREYRCLYLETGTQPFFAPARRLYERHGFRSCPPFGAYREDPHSAYFALAVPEHPGMAEAPRGF